LCNQLLLGAIGTAEESLDRCFTLAPLALVFARPAVDRQPESEVSSQVLDGGVDGFSKHRAVELVQHRIVQALDDAIGLWTSGFGAGVW
jgi:hypothetical protein